MRQPMVRKKRTIIIDDDDPSASGPGQSQPQADQHVQHRDSLYGVNVPYAVGHKKHRRSKDHNSGNDSQQQPSQQPSPGTITIGSHTIASKPTRARQGAELLQAVRNNHKITSSTATNRTSSNNNASANAHASTVASPAGLRSSHTHTSGNNVSSRRGGDRASINAPSTSGHAQAQASPLPEQTTLLVPVGATMMPFHAARAPQESLLSSSGNTNNRRPSATSNNNSTSSSTASSRHHSTSNNDGSSRTSHDSGSTRGHDVPVSSPRHHRDKLSSKKQAVTGSPQTRRYNSNIDDASPRSSGGQPSSSSSHRHHHDTSSSSNINQSKRVHVTSAHASPRHPPYVASGVVPSSSPSQPIASDGSSDVVILNHHRASSLANESVAASPTQSTLTVKSQKTGKKKTFDRHPTVAQENTTAVAHGSLTPSFATLFNDTTPGPIYDSPSPAGSTSQPPAPFNLFTLPPPAAASSSTMAMPSPSQSQSSDDASCTPPLKQPERPKKRHDRVHRSDDDDDDHKRVTLSAAAPAVDESFMHMAASSLTALSSRPIRKPTQLQLTAAPSSGDQLTIATSPSSSSRVASSPSATSSSSRSMLPPPSSSPRTVTNHFNTMDIGPQTSATRSKMKRVRRTSGSSTTSNVAMKQLKKRAMLPSDEVETCTTTTPRPVPPPSRSSLLAKAQAAEAQEQFAAEQRRRDQQKVKQRIVSSSPPPQHCRVSLMDAYAITYRWVKRSIDLVCEPTTNITSRYDRCYCVFSL